jgi:hypothetical protein
MDLPQSRTSGCGVAQYNRRTTTDLLPVVRQSLGCQEDLIQRMRRSIRILKTFGCNGAPSRGTFNRFEHGLGTSSAAAPV